LGAYICSPTQCACHDVSASSAQGCICVPALRFKRLNGGKLFLSCYLLRSIDLNLLLLLEASDGLLLSLLLKEDVTACDGSTKPLLLCLLLQCHALELSGCAHLLLLKLPA
tara:strand:- start:465 stop:797 length:333 start_codon:yes stop_codon:yes gene_type:complete